MRSSYGGVGHLNLKEDGEVDWDAMDKRRDKSENRAGFEASTYFKRKRAQRLKKCKRKGILW